MYHNDYDQDRNRAYAADDMEKTEARIRKNREDDGFRPSPEQWKQVDAIRSVLAMFPGDEKKVLEVLAVMDISEEDYRKLLRFTKPREDHKKGSFRSNGKPSFRKGYDNKGRGSKGSYDRNSKGPRSHGERSYSSKGNSSKGGYRKGSSDRGSNRGGYSKSRYGK